MLICKGYMAWKDGKMCSSLERTKRGVLISYDLIPLTGLKKTEDRLRSKGIVILPTSVTVCSEGERTGYGLTIKCRLDFCSLDIMHEGNMHYWGWVEEGGNKWLTLHCAYSHWTNHCKDSGEKKILNELFWFKLDVDNPELPHDKRRKSRLNKLREQAAEIFKKRKVEIVPVRAEKLK